MIEVDTAFFHRLSVYPQAADCGGRTMLVQFTISNYRSIKEPATISMVASADSSRPENCFPLEGSSRLRLLKSAAIYGANASGKSNLIKAVGFMGDFVVNSARRGQRGDPIPVVPFALDVESASKPSEFEVVLASGGHRYVYGFSADFERVHSEWLTIVGRKPSKLFVRGPGDEVSFGAQWRGDRKKLLSSLRPNALLLSVAVQLNNPTAQPVFDWFDDQLLTIQEGSFTQPGEYLTLATLRKNAELLSGRLDRLMQVADLGVSRLRLDPYRGDMQNAMQALLGGYFVPTNERDPEGPEGTSVPGTAGVRGVGVRAVHVTKDGHEVAFDLGDESGGTRRLFQLAGPWFRAIDTRGVLFVDELERNIHPLLMRHLVTAFHDAKGAQLVFTTHSSDLLDSGLLRRDQIWLMEKDSASESRLRSLWDFNIRKDANIRRGYLEGRYGATPVISEGEPWVKDA